MKMSAEFECGATAAVLRSGSIVALASHAAAVMSALLIPRGGPPAWIAFCSLLLWCAVIYLAIRIKIDARLFDLLATHPAEQLDEFLNITGLRKTTTSRTIAERRRAALRLWRALLLIVALQIALLLFAMLRALA